MKEDKNTVMIVSVFLTIVAIVSVIIALSNRNRYIVIREPKKETPKPEPVAMGTAKQKEEEEQEDFKEKIETAVKKCMNTVAPMIIMSAPNLTKILQNIPK